MFATPGSRAEKVQDRPRLCLNMIVKNEAAIISRCLTSVAPYISCWSILDTGSTDSTCSIIREFFGAWDIPGELHQAEFVDFSTSRNQALQLCRDSGMDFEYILLIDADMELQAMEPSWHSSLRADAYKLQQQASVYYDNLRLLRRDAKAGYVGVTHEFLSVSGRVDRLDQVIMLDHASGSNRVDKFTRDVKLLLQGLQEEPDNFRYMFYLAQSLKDVGDYAAAISWYHKHVVSDSWEEERWYSAYQIANCLLLSGEQDAGISAALAAWNQRPWRSEPLALLSRHFRTAGQYQLCCEFASIGLRIPFPQQDSLFIEASLYQWFFRQELSIAGFYATESAHRELGRQFCQQLAISPQVAPGIRQTARNNLRFYAPLAASWLDLQVLEKLEIEKPMGWSNLNPSIAIAGMDKAVLLRQVNYQLQQGRYIIKDSAGQIRTQNHLLTLDKNLQPTNGFPVTGLAGLGAERTGFPVQGYEDGRLIRFQGDWWISATVRDTNVSGICEIALLRLSAQGRIAKEYLLRGPWSEQHQKNWMPFVFDDQLHFVFSLSPTVILRFNEHQGRAEEVHRSNPTQALEHLRGGGQLVKMDDGAWLGICHEASADAEGQRHYLHRFFLLDQQWNLNAISDAFSLSGEAIEFCCGLSRQPHSEQLLVSYGVNDNQALLSSVSLASVLQRLIRIS